MKVAKKLSLNKEETCFELRRALTIVFSTLLISMMLLGCGTSTPEIRPLERVDYPTDFQFIRNSQTKREEILERLGGPRLKYDDGRILVYVVGSNDLIFVFGPTGSLEKHSVFAHGEILEKGIKSFGAGGVGVGVR